MQESAEVLERLSVECSKVRHIVAQLQVAGLWLHPMVQSMLRVLGGKTRQLHGRYRTLLLQLLHHTDPATLHQ